MSAHRLSPVALMVLCSASAWAAPLTAPGTTERPQLSRHEADSFSSARYFSASGPGQQDWQPTPITTPERADFIVGPAGAPGVSHHSVQQAVNAALAHGHARRQYIQILPGSYSGTVYIPANAGPLTLYGAGDDATAVKLTLALDSMMNKATWQRAVIADGRYRRGDPAWPMVDTCLQRTGDMVTTLCSAVFWAQNDRLQLRTLTVENALLDSVDGGPHQGVALRTDGDRIQLDNVRLIGRQDTFFVNNSDALNRYVTDRHTRVEVKNSYIEGDVDFVFGRAAAVFDNTHFHVVSSRQQREAWVFAPDTVPGNRYGFLVTHSRLTGDKGWQQLKTAGLGRAWDQGAKDTGYLPGQTSNGQVVIRDSQIDGSFHQSAPWGPAATTQRPFSALISADRDLNDPHHNRLWEYNNHLTDGSAQ